MPSAFTEADLIAIRSAIARGEVEVQFADRRVRYHSMGELLEAEARILATLNATSATPRPRQTQCIAGKGFFTC